MLARVLGSSSISCSSLVMTCAFYQLALALSTVAAAGAAAIKAQVEVFLRVAIRVFSCSVIVVGFIAGAVLISSVVAFGGTYGNGATSTFLQKSSTSLPTLRSAFMDACGISTAVGPVGSPKLVAKVVPFHAPTLPSEVYALNYWLTRVVFKIAISTRRASTALVGTAASYAFLATALERAPRAPKINLLIGSIAVAQNATRHKGTRGVHGKDPASPVIKISKVSNSRERLPFKGRHSTLQVALGIAILERARSCSITGNCVTTAIPHALDESSQIRFFIIITTARAGCPFGDNRVLIQGHRPASFSFSVRAIVWVGSGERLIWRTQSVAGRAVLTRPFVVGLITYAALSDPVLKSSPHVIAPDNGVDAAISSGPRVAINVPNSGPTFLASPGRILGGGVSGASFNEVLIPAYDIVRGVLKALSNKRQRSVTCHPSQDETSVHKQNKSKKYNEPWNFGISR